MTTVVQFSGPREVAIVDEPEQPLVAGHLRVRTWYSGISAGTELTAYRGFNPYQSKTWNPNRRIVVAGAPTLPYPSTGWGYEGAVALNAVLAADLHVGEDVAVFGQGVHSRPKRRRPCRRSCSSPRRAGSTWSSSHRPSSKRARSGSPPGSPGSRPAPN